ncbi:TIGR01777 family protein [Longimonas halophila]|uniref:TIGR01777 family protein n=1 Tax=Longimonas halophila TaxID=1469170 RepID=A0A2H3P4F3_9BACT|nr:TIGR01777 family oxidoreductase [Longimonas halophila]PEN06532.1 TIGR01777 family protein [Longimonas halophila]
MPTLRFPSVLDVSAQALYDWHARPGAFERLTPPWAPVQLAAFEGIENGERAVIRLGYEPLALTWIAEHHSHIARRQFCDRQVQGPFKQWNHTHRFEPISDTRSRLVDDITYDLPLAPLSTALAPYLAEPELRRQFAYRHRITRHDLDLHARYDTARPTVAVSGSSGLVGRALVAFLRTGGYPVRRLVRRSATRPDEITWNPSTGQVDAEALASVDAVVHLAGENVFAPRWTATKKARIFDSRVRGTRLLADALASLNDPPDTFISASAVGAYGDRGDTPVTEANAPRTTDFLGEVCAAWEGATAPAESAGIRTVNLRIGVVLAANGGALQVLSPLVQAGLGGTPGRGTAFVPWIALDDLLGSIVHTLHDDTLAGPVNATAPAPVRMRTLVDTLGTIFSRPTPWRIPEALIRAVSGEAADAMALKSIRARPARLTAHGFTWTFGELPAALRHALGRTLRPHQPQRM